jgi:uncharacterized SAM-binding protein YcdF (DUF218 family)
VRCPAGTSAGIRRSARCVSAWLARRDRTSLAEIGEVDLIVVPGNAVLQSCQVAAAAWQRHRAASVLLSGAAGHSTSDLRKRAANALSVPPDAFAGGSEAAILRAVVVAMGVPPTSIVIEDRSANTGENAAFSLHRIQELDLSPKRVLLVQDPTMARRTHETFRRVWDTPGIRLMSWAPFTPAVADTGPGCPAWSWPRFVALLLGEVRRLTNDEYGYGPRGKNFIDAVEVPSTVAAATAELHRAYPELVR